MQIACSCYKCGINAISRATQPQTVQKESGTSFAGVLDKVSISNEAKTKASTFAQNVSKPDLNGSYVTRAMEDWHKRYFEEKNLAPDQNSEAWLPENREKLHQIWAEMDELTAAEPDPANRTDETNQKLTVLLAQRTVLEVFGKEKIVTDQMMNEGASAFMAAEMGYAKSENMIIEDWRNPQGGFYNHNSIMQIYLNQLFGKSEDLENNLMSWENKQLDEDKAATGPVKA